MVSTLRSENVEFALGILQDLEDQVRPLLATEEGAHIAELLRLLREALRGA